VGLKKHKKGGQPCNRSFKGSTAQVLMRPGSETEGIVRGGGGESGMLYSKSACFGWDSINSSGAIADERSKKV